MDTNHISLDIFKSLFERRPEITPEKLSQDLSNYLVPYAQKLISLKKTKKNTDSLIIGVSAIQGAGKTTQGEILEILLKYFGYSSVSLSIDDHYLTHLELNKLRSTDPRFIRRGVTHDIELAKRNLSDVKCMKDQPVLVAGYDKGAHQGDGDRFAFVKPVLGLTLTLQVVGRSLKLRSIQYQHKPLAIPQNMGADLPLDQEVLPKELEKMLLNQDDHLITVSDHGGANVLFSGKTHLVVSQKDLPKAWTLITKKPDFIFYDGWMLGARTVQDESIFDSGLPALKKPEDIQFAKMVNKKLASYDQLWDMIDFLNVLYVPNYQMSLKWRDQAEESLRKRGEGMTHKQIEEFVHYFWRSVHPAIHIKNLAHDLTHTDQVTIIEDDHSVKELLNPKETAEKYP